MVPQVKLPLSVRMKSFPIEYVLRQASVDVRPPLPVSESWISAKANEKRFGQIEGMPTFAKNYGAAVSRRDAQL